MERTVSRFRALFLAVCCLALCGCATVKAIRIQNVSTRDYSNVRIADQHFGEAAAGETSDYRNVTLRSRYAAMETTIDGRRVTGQTLNFGADRLTYRINIADLAKGHLAIKIVRD